MTTTQLDIRYTQNFDNDPEIDFTIAENRVRYQAALDALSKNLGGHVYPTISGKEIKSTNTLPSLNPNDFNQAVATIHLASQQDAASAVDAAHEAYTSWSQTDPLNRANILRKAAAITRSQIFTLAATQTLEVGKQWAQAYADVTEGIDFLEYYANEIERLTITPPPLRSHPGERNDYAYEPRGVALVIAPWNFPFAIAIGMVAAALVTGNTVVFKPSERASLVANQVFAILTQAGIPSSALHFLPGLGSEIGDPLVDNPKISTIAFTGSMQTGLRITQRAAITHPGQTHIKRVICEMGGKNAIIIDNTADLDQAIPGVLYSAFAFQGQKCSACSRLIIHEDLYDRACQRLVDAAKSLSIGPASDPKHYCGAIIDQVALDKYNQYRDIALQEGSLLYQSPALDLPGFFAPLLIVDGITPEHRIAQEEVFAPILAVMRAKNLDQALEFANSTQFRLTGAAFSRSPENIERIRRDFRVGNLYINRGSTGALVARQPFGGAYMSGAGTKAGGPDYLLQFLNPRVITENTQRRGFSPDL